MTVKAGYKGDVWYGADYKVASGTWTYSGETRNMQDIDEFQDEIVKQLPLQIVGGDITITGNYLLDSDQGQKQLKVDFNAATGITNLRLYTDKTGAIYMTPKAGSSIVVTNVNNVGDDKSGVGTLSATLHVNGELEQIGSTTQVSVLTVGALDPANGGAGADNGTVTLWGELIHRGGEAGDLDCYFQWDKTPTSWGNNSKANETVFVTPNKGVFDNDETEVTGLSENTLYYYRAVCELADTTKVYGVVKTFTVPADA